MPDPAVPLVYWEWIASAEESCAYDGAAISIDGLVLQQFGLSPTSDTHAVGAAGHRSGGVCRADGHAAHHRRNRHKRQQQLLRR
ncbi:MAG: hypothetical protein R2838_00255 [Caldilineaceae bacterium]